MSCTVFSTKFLVSTQSGKIKDYKAVTRPMATRGEKFWALDEGTDKRLAAFGHWMKGLLNGWLLLKEKF
jgi:hypothetical protein